MLYLFTRTSDCLFHTETVTLTVNESCEYLKTFKKFAYVMDYSYLCSREIK